MNVVIDIETIPCDKDLCKHLPPIAPPRTLKDESRIKKWRSEKLSQLQEEQYQKTSLDPNFGRIFCIGMLFFSQRNDNHQSISIFGQQESLLLSEFWKTIERYKNPYIITHNGLTFDLPFIWKRSVIQKVTPTLQFNLSRYNTNYIYDTMAVWGNWDMRGAIKLDELAKILGVARKSGTGADVYDLWRAGRHKDIAEYCFQDIYVTYCCYCRMTFIKHVDRTKIPMRFVDLG